MHNAELYSQNNTLQKRDVIQCLKEYATKVQWKNNGDASIDIGCGDGSITFNILKKFLPYNCKKLLGCDKSEKMIQFANKNNACDKTSYMLLNIEEVLCDELRENFEHAFSFFVLHWVTEQKVAFTNIYDLLRKGGDCFLIFMGILPMFEVFRTQSRNPKWSHWIKDTKRCMSPYHDSQDPEKEIKTLLTSIGFIDVEVKCTWTSYCYTTTDAFKKSLDAVLPFHIPEELKEDYLEDHVNILQESPLVQRIKNNNDELTSSITVNYQLLTVYGKK